MSGPSLRRLTQAARAGNPLPPGSLAIGVGLLVNGIATYVFLALSRRTLGETPYASFAVLWGLVFILGPGLFQPLEQELSRATADRSMRGLGSAPVLRKASVLGSAGLAIIAAAVLIAWPLGLDGLLDENLGLLFGLLFALTAFMAAELVRGVLSGRHRFPRYGAYMASEGLGRLLIAVFLTVAGLHSVGWFATAMGGSFVLASMVGVGRGRSFTEPGPQARWSELTPALLVLLGTSLGESFLLNVGPILVGVLSDDPDAAGRFLNGLIVARVPLFLFAAVKAALLPNLASMAAGGDMAGFRRLLSRLLAAVIVVVTVGTAGAAAVGPWIVELVFDDSLRSVDMGLLAASSLGAMVVLSLALALIALGRARAAAAGWLAGAAALPPGLLIGSEPFLRVELALVAATATAAVVMAAALSGASRRRPV